MPSFKFRLAPVLKLREAARDERRLELAEAYRVDDLLRQRQEQTGEELEMLRENCRRAASPGVVDVDRLVESQRYELNLRSQERELQRQREGVSAEIERRRLALVEADREVKVLEKLRQKQAERHQQEQNRREIKLLDETAQRRFAREMVS
jgi:flagellar protein FliJ